MCVNQNHIGCWKMSDDEAISESPIQKGGRLICHAKAVMQFIHKTKLIFKSKSSSNN